MKKILLLSLIALLLGTGVNNIYANEESTNSGSFSPKQQTENVDFSNYIAGITKEILSLWKAPAGHLNSQTILLFSIDKQGNISNIRTIVSSGSEEFDNSAIDTLKKAAPFEPLPEKFSGTSIDIKFSFDKSLNKLNNSEKAFSNRILNIDSMMIYAKEHARFDMTESGISYYSKAIKSNPENAELYRYRSLCYSSKNEYTKALNDANKAIKLAPENPYNYIAQGTAYYGMNRNNLAIESFSKAIKIDSQNAIAYYGRGIAYNKLKKYDRALENYNKAYEIDSHVVNKFVYYTDLSDCYRGLGNNKKARYYRKEADKISSERKRFECFP